MENNNGGSPLCLILGILVVIVFAAWLLGGTSGSNSPAGRGSNSPAAGWVLKQ